MIRKNAKSAIVTKLKGGSSLDIPPQLSPEELIPTINDRLRRINQAAADTRAQLQTPTGLEVQNNGALPSSSQAALNLIPGTNVTISSVANPDKKRTDVTIASALQVDKTGVLVGTRGKLNFIDGANISVTVADNPGTSAVDVTVAATGAGSSGYTPPLLSSFSWVNQGSSTASGGAGGPLVMSQPEHAGDNWSMLVKSLPSAPYTITVLLNAVVPGYNYHMAGIALRDSGTGKIATNLWSANNGALFSILRIYYSSPTIYVANATPLLVGLSGVLGLRIQDTGVNRVMSFSYDGGVSWIQHDSVSRTDYLTPNQIGFALNSNNSGGSALGCAITILSYVEGP